MTLLGNRHVRCTLSSFLAVPRWMSIGPTVSDSALALSGVRGVNVVSQGQGYGISLQTEAEVSST